MNELKNTDKIFGTRFATQAITMIHNLKAIISMMILILPISSIAGNDGYSEELKSKDDTFLKKEIIKHGVAYSACAGVVGVIGLMDLLPGTSSVVSMFAAYNHQTYRVGDYKTYNNRWNRNQSPLLIGTYAVTDFLGAGITCGLSSISTYRVDACDATYASTEALGEVIFEDGSHCFEHKEKLEIAEKEMALRWPRIKNQALNQTSPSRIVATERDKVPAMVIGAGSAMRNTVGAEQGR